MRRAAAAERSALPTLLLACLWPHTHAFNLKLPMHLSLWGGAPVHPLVVQSHWLAVPASSFVSAGSLFLCLCRPAYVTRLFELVRSASRLRPHGN